MWARLELDFGGGQPTSAEVHFGLQGNAEPDGTQVGLNAVKTAAGDILGALTQTQQEMVKDAVLRHLEALKESLP